MFRILIVVSDPVSRSMFRDALVKNPWRWDIQECRNGLEAIPTLGEFRPDVFVCEIELPGLDGFSLLKTISDRNGPATIFISSHSQFAVRAFEVAAVDYLLKPMSEERLLQALERARNSVTVRGDSSSWHSGGWKPDHLTIRSGRSVIFIKSDELDWADAEGKYVRLHMGKENLLLKISISALERELDPLRFVRIHRSTLVNIDRIRLIQPWSRRRTYRVTLHDGTCLVLSRKTKLRAVSEASNPLLPA